MTDRHAATIPGATSVARASLRTLQALLVRHAPDDDARGRVARALAEAAHWIGVALLAAGHPSATRDP